ETCGFAVFLSCWSDEQLPGRRSSCASYPSPCFLPLPLASNRTRPHNCQLGIRVLVVRLAKQRRKTSRIFIFSRRVTRADRKIDKDRLANAGINIHIDADGLIRDNREPLRLGKDIFACAILPLLTICAT